MSANDQLAMPMKLPEATIDDQLRCVDREIAMRERVYPERVRRGQMTPAKMQDELRIMKAVRATLCQIKERELQARAAQAGAQ